MKLRFYGDSWYWSWFYLNKWKSQAVKNSIVKTSAFPALELFFKNYGVDCINECEPGWSFHQIVNKIENSKINRSVKYNIVFFSNLIRGDDPTHSFDVGSYENFITKWKADTIDLLQRLQKWADQNDQQVILLGGQSTISKEIFNSINPKSNFQLLSECVSRDILTHYYGEKIVKPFGIFKLAHDFSYLVNETWHPNLVKHTYEDRKHWEDTIIEKNFFNPDTAHLNTTGQLFLVDLILAKIEELEKG